MSRSKYPFKLDELYRITNIDNLKYLEKGESLAKFTGEYKGENIVLRYIPDDKYLPNKFEREGDVMRLLSNQSDHLHKYNFTTPKIIGEWPKYKLRVIQYLDGDAGVNLSQDIINNYIECFESIKFDTKYHFKNGVYSSVNNTNGILPQYINDFEEARDKIVNNFGMVEDTGLIHGDFHRDNLINMNESIGIIDWEYAAQGSIYYDIAYYIEMYYESKNIIFKSSSELNQRIDSWKPIVSLILTHWYLLNNPNDKKNKKRMKRLISFL